MEIILEGKTLAAAIKEKLPARAREVASALGRAPRLVGISWQGDYAGHLYLNKEAAAARTQKIPVILDGYVIGAAAAVLHAIDPSALDHCIAGHVSAEPGHRRLLERLGKRPLLDLGLRLGEGTGAAAALSLVRLACEVHGGMATFDQAGVSGKG